MGQYATTTSFSELLPQYFSGNTTTSDTEGTAIVSRHIDRAEAKINACIVKRYVLPFSTTAIPPILRCLAEDIASWFTLRGSFVQDGNRRQEYLEDYERAMETLDSIKNGETKLALTDGSLVPARTSTRILSTTKNYTPIFGKDDEQAWKRDQNEIDDQSDARQSG